jgi:hypothetical protein
MIESNLNTQRDFSAGQLDESSLRRDDTEIMRAGVRRGRNVRILNTNALKRRPGRRALFETSGIVDQIRPAPADPWFISLEAGRIVFRSRDLSSSQTFTGMPWTFAMLRNLRWVENAGTVIVAGPKPMRPQVFSFNRSTRSWTHAPFSFSTDVTGAVRQPFYNFFLGSGITMQPNARSGAITINFSGPVLDPAHVGVRFRYAGRQIEITSIISPSAATANAIEQLPPTVTVTLDTYEGLQVGDVVEGLDSGARGQVVSLGAPLVVLITNNWSGFSVDETFVGPRSRGKVTGIGVPAPAATTLWEEALCSDFRGWPQSVNKSVQRIAFQNFEQLSAAIIWSSIGTINDFLVGAAPDDAIFELVPANCVVYDVVEGSDIFVFTDEGPYYIPFSASSPLIPGSVEFRSISDDAASPIRPQPTSDGLVYVNAGLTRVLSLIATGQSAKPYLVEDISEFHANLIRKPIALASTSVDASAPERYLYAVNNDGTLAVARYQRQQSGRGWVGWVEWDGAGDVVWANASDGDVVVTAVYPTGSGTIRFGEVFDDTLLLDGSRSLASVTGSDALEVSPGVPLEVALGDPLLVSQEVAFNWAVGTMLSVEQNGWYRGDYTIEADGTLSGVIPAQNTVGLVGGFKFAVEVEPFIPHVEPGQSRQQRMRRRRLKQVAVTVQRTQAIEVAGRLVPFWRGGENEEEAPPMRDETYRARPMGRSYDPRWSVKQDLPGALTIVELATEVTV